eukprot:14528417-Heterocapsa_arctica.AAC.1
MRPKAERGGTWLSGRHLASAVRCATKRCTCFAIYEPTRSNGSQQQNKYKRKRITQKRKRITNNRKRIINNSVKGSYKTT